MTIRLAVTVIIGADPHLIQVAVCASSDRAEEDLRSAVRPAGGTKREGFFSVTEDGVGDTALPWSNGAAVAEVGSWDGCDRRDEGRESREGGKDGEEEHVYDLRR